MKLIKKLGVLLTVLTLLISSVSLFPIKVQAKGKPYMKGVDVRWNLKPDKEVSFTTNYRGYKYITIKAKVKDFKIEASDKEGYNQLSCKLVYTFPKFKLSKKQVDKIISIEGGFNFMFTVLDYDTGLSLEGANDKDVTLESGGLQHSDDRYTCAGSNGNEIQLIKSASVDIKVTYPKDYKGLCLMVGGATKEPDSAFFEGAFPLKKSSYYKKGMKNLSSLMRVKDIKTK